MNKYQQAMGFVKALEAQAKDIAAGRKYNVNTDKVHADVEYLAFELALDDGLNNGEIFRSNAGYLKHRAQAAHDTVLEACKR